MDLRIPSGSLFLIIGAILIGLGVAAPSMRAPLTAINVNLYAGLAIAIFGGVLLWMTKRRS